MDPTLRLSLLTLALVSTKMQVFPEGVKQFLWVLSLRCGGVCEPIPSAGLQGEMGGEGGTQVGRDGANVLMWNIPLATEGEREADNLPPKPHSPRNLPGPSINLARCPL